MTGEEVRATRFARGAGYDASEVDELLSRVAAELDAGRPVWPLIEDATFQSTLRGYDIDAVDWFLGQLLRRPGEYEAEWRRLDPWRDLGELAQSTIGGPNGQTDGLTQPTRRAASRLDAAQRKHLAAECQTAWQEFGQVPGMSLRWAAVGAARRALLSMDSQAIASVRGSARSITVGAAARRLAFKKPARPTSSWSPRRAEIATRTSRDGQGHFAAEPTRTLKPGQAERGRRSAEAAVRALTD